MSKKEYTDYKYLPLKNRIIKSSNYLVSAKYNSSLLENKIMYIARARIEENCSKDSTKPLEAKIYPSELISLIGDKSHIYRTLSETAKSITSRSIVIEDGQGNFKSFAMITNANYENGVFTIKFNDEMRSHILDIQGAYTKTDLLIQSSVSSNTSFRLNELFSKEMYRSKSNGGPVQVEYRIAELKSIIGLIDLSNNLVQKEMTLCKQQLGVLDWDVIYDRVSQITIKAIDKKGKPKEVHLTKYNEWRDFQRSVLQVAQEEMKEKSTVCFDYKPIREGRKIKKVLFTIYPNKPKQVVSDFVGSDTYKTDNNINTFVDFYNEFTGHNDLTTDDLDMLLKKADYDEKKVRKMIELADKQDNINNYVGWLIKAVENGYTETEVVKGSIEKAKTVKAVRKELEDNRQGLSNKAWMKIKQKADFSKFEEFLQEHSLDLEMFEIIYEPDECVKMFCDWKVGREVDL